MDCVDGLGGHRPAGLAHGGPGVYTNMDEWMTIRRRVLVEGVSKRQILRTMGMHWTTLEKILEHSEPPGYRRRRARRRSMGTGVFLGARLRLAPRHTPGTQRKLSLALVHETGEGQPCRAVTGDPNPLGWKSSNGVTWASEL